MRRENGSIWITHSTYYSRWTGGLPFRPHVYWNLISDQYDRIPVCTYGYKNHSTAEAAIRRYVNNIKELVFIYEQSEQEYQIEYDRIVLMIRDYFTDSVIHT